MNVCKIVPQSFPPVYSNPNRYFSAYKESSHKQLKPHIASSLPTHSPVALWHSGIKTLVSREVQAGR